MDALSLREVTAGVVAPLLAPAARHATTGASNAENSSG